MSVVRSLKDHVRDGWVHRWARRQQEPSAVAEWTRAGCPTPPPQVVKHRLIRQVGRRARTRVFVETGTHRGDAIAASLDTFDQLHSIELSDELYERARRRFSRFSQVTLHHGDSATELAAILAGLNQPCTFWLDAHYSGEGTARASVDTPILTELMTIARHRVSTHAILIDDARVFNGRLGYPTVEQCGQIAAEHWPTHRFSIINDMMLIEP